MDNGQLMKLLKMQLEISTDYMDAAAVTTIEADLLIFLQAAENYIATEGIVLRPDDAGDQLLVVMYAAYLYGKRKSDNAPMPRMLRYALNNRLLSQKAAE